MEAERSPDESLPNPPARHHDRTQDANLLSRHSTDRSIKSEIDGSAASGHSGVDDVVHPEAHLAALKQTHEVQQQILMSQFREQQDRLMYQQQQQIHEQMKAVIVRNQMVKHHEEREKQRMLAIKHKSADQQSAVASAEVKQKLTEFLRNKKQRETAHGRASPPPQFGPWSRQYSSLEQSSPPTAGMSPPYQANSGSSGSRRCEFPLRKTMSDSNLKVKSRLKEKVQRNSPLSRRREVHRYHRAKAATLSVDTNLTSSNPDSGPNTPPGALAASRLTGVAHEAESLPLHIVSKMLINHSMPNISSCGLSESELSALHYNILQHPQIATLAFAQLCHGEASADQTASIATAAGQLSSSSPRAKVGGIVPGVPYPMGLSGLSHESRSAILRRPLNRTHSAPVPIHLKPENLRKEQLAKQRLQSSLLQRSASKTQMEDVEEAQEQAESEDVVIISDSSDSAIESPTSSHVKKERLLHLHHRQRTVSSGSPPVHSSKIGHASPSMSLSPQTSTESTCSGPHVGCTALVYDQVMLKHACVCSDASIHPEHPERLLSIWSQLNKFGLVQRCEHVRSRKATMEELQLCHSDLYCVWYGQPHSRHHLSPQQTEMMATRFCRLACGGIGVDSDTTWNEQFSPGAVRTATGCVIELAMKVATGEMRNGMALVRPPGHHAEYAQAMGFCFFNSIAIATKTLQRRLKVPKILIVDWDVHHGNSTQVMFYDNPSVLYISLHRHDNGNFFPGTGAINECGSGAGLGYNVNIAWMGSLNPPMGDAEYLAAFRCVVMPISRQFQPDVVLVSAGFDAATGHTPQLGGYSVSPACFAHMTRQLMTLAGGRLALILEGGYNLTSIGDCSVACVRTLLGDPVTAIAASEAERPPHPISVQVLEQLAKEQSVHWDGLMEHLQLAVQPHAQLRTADSEESDTVSAFASLSVVRENVGVTSEPMDQL